MFHFNPNAYDIYEQDRQDCIRRAEEHHVRQIAKQSNKSPSFARKRLAWLGDLLVKWGHAMQIQPTETSLINTISRPVS